MYPKIEDNSYMIDHLFFSFLCALAGLIVGSIYIEVHDLYAKEAIREMILLTTIGLGFLVGFGLNLIRK